MDTKQTPSEITENIKLISSKCASVVRFETDKFLGLLSGDIDKLIGISTDYTKKIEEQRIRWETVNKEIKDCEVRRDALKEKEASINKKAIELNELEDNLAKLHEILEGRRKSLDIKEKELINKEKASNEKIAKPL